ncbi:hypothetical protein GCM10009761_10810 [Agromyces terreus]
MIDRTIRRARRVAREAYLTSGLPSRLDHARILRTVRGARRPGAALDGPHVLLAAPGGGNIGDQAMFEAFIEGTAGAVTVIVRSAAEIAVPAPHAERVTVLELPHLVYGSRRAHRADVTRFGELLRTAASLSVVGADIMDGRYVLRPSVRRSALAGAAGGGGVDNRGRRRRPASTPASSGSAGTGRPAPPPAGPWSRRAATAPCPCSATRSRPSARPATASPASATWPTSSSRPRPSTVPCSTASARRSRARTRSST